MKSYAHLWAKYLARWIDPLRDPPRSLAHSLDRGGSGAESHDVGQGSSAREGLLDKQTYPGRKVTVMGVVVGVVVGLGRGTLRGCHLPCWDSQWWSNQVLSNLQSRVQETNFFMFPKSFEIKENQKLLISLFLFCSLVLYLFDSLVLFFFCWFLIFSLWFSIVSLLN